MQDKQSSVMDSSEHLSKSPVTSLQNITDLPSTLPLPNTSLSVNDTGKSDIPAPPLVTRGSAPSGTFCIPEEGLRVSLTRSFLSRFQTVISPPVEPTIKKDLPDTSDINSNSNPTESILLPLEQTPSELENVSSNFLQLQLSTDDEYHGNTNESPILQNDPEYSQLSQHQFNKPLSNQSSTSLHDTTIEPEQPLLPPVHVEPTEPEYSSALEHAADEVEDTLINIVSDYDSLLHDSRPSYPILRFCAGTALIDVSALDNLGLPLGFIWSPFGEMESLDRISRSPNRCGTCGSFLAKGNGGEDVLIGTRFWTCGFCGRNDNDAGELGFQANVTPSIYPELLTDVVEYLHPQSAVRSSAGRGAIIMIVDENLEPEEAEWSRAATAAVHMSAAEKGLRFALLTVGSGCSVAVKEQAGEEMTPTMEMMSVARASKLIPEEKEYFYLDPPVVAVDNTTKAKSATTQKQAYTDILLTPRAYPEMKLLPSEEGKHSSEGRIGNEIEAVRKARLPPDAEPRRLDVALCIAFELISGMADSENSRILSLVTGPPTLAEHALRRNYIGKDGTVKAGDPNDDAEANAALAKLYEQVGARAGDMRIALDFLCFGASSGFGGPILLGAAKRSRGGLLYTAAHSFSASSALAEAATFLADRSTSPGVISIRVSSPLVIARVIGPAFPTAAPHTYAVPGIDPTTGFTVILKAKAGINSEASIPSHAVVQLAAKSLEATRVVTARLPVSRNASEYLASLDAKICALVLGKACVVSGGALTQPAIAARSVDVSIRRLLCASEASITVVRLMFELRRGLLIEQQGNADCALVLRSFFLRADYLIGSLLMSPRLFTNGMLDENTGLMAEVPLEKKFVTRDSVLVLDTGFNVFVYVGEDATQEAEKAISESARSVAAQRISPCQLWKLRPGPDADYLLDSYLSPSSSSQPVAGKRDFCTFDKGFLQYCISLAPDSPTVQALLRS